ncbi:MAG: serine/threonine-protein kinase, partial [Planctomycetota bacterium]
MPDAHDPTLHGRRNTRPLPRPEPTLPGTRPARLQPPTTTRQGEHPAPGGFARFRLGDELGRGGIGVVRLAEDTDLNRELAIKLLQRADDAADVSRFIEEAQITAQLEHPNIVPVHELGRDAQGRPWLAMKRIAGQSLADMIRAEAAGGGASRPLRAEDTNRIIALFNKVADALAFAHSRGVVHRDIKPHNVMVGEFGEVLLVDWGLARPLDAPDAGARPVRSSRRAAPRADDSALSMDGDVFGTPAYMAPEQADGRVSEVDERSDIFSLGGVLYHMLTLEPPYPGRSAAEVLGRALRHHLAPPRRRAPRRGIPRELEAIVLKAMAARPADRYQRVADMQADLAAWQSLRPTTAWRPGPIARAIRLVRRHPMTSVTAALLLMGTQIVALIVLQLQLAER